VEISSEHSVEGGLTKREYIATRLMAALLSVSTAPSTTHAKMAAEAADALIAELNKAVKS
jgi:hypothetical protein